MGCLKLSCMLLVKMGWLTLLGSLLLSQVKLDWLLLLRLLLSASCVQPIGQKVGYELTCRG